MEAEGYTEFTEKELDRFFAKESDVLDICTDKRELLGKINEKIKEARHELLQELVKLSDIEKSEFEQYQVWMEYIKENLHN